MENEIVTEEKDFFNKYDECKNKNEKIKLIYSFIIESLRSNKMSAIVGAGFSKNVISMYPDWSELVIDAYKELYPKEARIKKQQSQQDYKKMIVDLINSKSATVIAQEYEKYKGKRESLDIYIEDQFEKYEEEKKDLELHTKFLSLKWCDVVTTNWDLFLEDANRITKNFYIVRNAKELKIANRKRIIKINGTLRTNTEKKSNIYYFDGCYDHLYIITPEDFEKYESDHEDFSNFMKVKFLENSFCLFGFSGNDTNFRYWIRELKRTMTKGGRTEKPNPIFLIDTEEKEPSRDLQQFYYNNYIYRVSLPEIINILDPKKSEPLTYLETGIRIKNQFKLFFDLISREIEEKYLTRTRNNEYSLTRNLIMKNTFSNDDKHQYSDIPVFDYQNLTFDTAIAGKAQSLTTTIDKWEAEDFSFVYHCCINNFYSLTNLYKDDDIDKIIERYEEILLTDTSFEFCELVLKYYREREKLDLFNIFYKKYISKPEMQNYLYYEKGLLLHELLDVHGLDELLQTWKPENNSKTAIHIFRKISLLFTFNNYRYTQSIQSEVISLFEAAITIEKDSELAYLINLMYSFYLRSLGKEVNEIISTNIRKLEKDYTLPEKYLKSICKVDNNKNSCKPNSDTRFTYTLSICSNQNDNDQIISICRYMNFFEYTGLSVVGNTSIEKLQSFIPLIAGRSNILNRLLSITTSLFGDSADEPELRFIAPRVFRYFEDFRLVNLFRAALDSFKYKITEKQNATVFFYLLAELTKRVDAEEQKDYIECVVNLLMNKEDQFMNKISFGRVWGWEKPFIVFLRLIKKTEMYENVLLSIMENYIDDVKRNMNSEKENFSEYYIFYCELMQNETFEKSRESFFNTPKIISILDEDFGLDKKLNLLAYKYLCNEQKNKVKNFVEEKYNIQIDPFIITQIPSVKVKQICLTILTNFNLGRFDSRNYSLLRMVKILLQENLLEKQDVLQIVSICKRNFDVLIKNNNQYRKDLTSYYFKMFEEILLEIYDVQADTMKAQIKDILDLYLNCQEYKTEVLTLTNVSIEDTSVVKRLFTDSLTEFSYLHSAKENLYLFNLVLSKLVVQDSADFEGILGQFISAYSNGYEDTVFENEETEKILLVLLTKFKNNIAYCYDDLFIKEQMIKLTEVMTSKKRTDKNEVIEYWINQKGQQNAN